MNFKDPVYILGIESSCDDTAAAVSCDRRILSNLIANQEIHRNYGGVVPELASRAHQKNIIPVVDQALIRANVDKKQLSAIAYTKGPGLLGSLLVGSCFAKMLAASLNIPLIGVNHLEAHVLANFIENDGDKPAFPFLSLTVSGGHTQIVLVKDYLDLKVIGQTEDDAAGESFDKIARIMGLPYPGGPEIDRLAKAGNPHAFEFPRPKMPGLSFSFSGLKTSVYNFLVKQTDQDPGFLKEHLADVCASLQHTISEILLDKLTLAATEMNIDTICLSGGVAANSYLRKKLREKAEEKGWKVYIPDFEYCTDNAAMICISAYFKFSEGLFESRHSASQARFPIPG